MCIACVHVESESPNSGLRHQSVVLHLQVCPVLPALWSLGWTPSVSPLWQACEEGVMGYSRTEMLFFLAPGGSLLCLSCSCHVASSRACGKSRVGLQSRCSPRASRSLKAHIHCPGPSNHLSMPHLPTDTTQLSPHTVLLECGLPVL